MINEIDRCYLRKTYQYRGVLAFIEMFVLIITEKIVIIDMYLIEKFIEIYESRIDELNKNEK